MEDLFVPYEIALEMKLLEFDKPCCKYVYTGDTGTNCNRFEEVLPSKAKNYNAEDLCVSQPTFAQCFKFFREKYNLHIVISWRDDLSNYDISLIEMKKSGYFYYKENLKSYEEAELACVTELINIVKKKKP